MEHPGGEGHHLPGRELVHPSLEPDIDPPAQQVDGDDAVGPVLREVGAGLEGEQHEGHRPAAEERNLAVPPDGVVRLGPQPGRGGLEIEELHRLGEPVFRMGPQALGG